MTKRRVVHIKILKRARNKLLDSMMSGVITPNEITVMNQKPIDLNRAIVAQQETRTPAPQKDPMELSHVPEKKKTNRLSLGQGYALKLWLEQYKIMCIGKSTDDIARSFNFDVAASHSDFKGGAIVTKNNVYGFLADMGLGLRQDKVVALRNDVFTPIQPAVAEAPKRTEIDPGHIEANAHYPAITTRDGFVVGTLPAGLRSVQAFVDEDGNRYDTLAAYYEANKIEELGKSIRNNSILNAAEARELAARIVTMYDIKRV